MSAAEYYSHGSYPATRSSLSSSAMRSELELIEAGFGKLPDILGNGSKLVAINAGATALEAITTGTGILAFLATPSSANLRSALTDETGSGSAVFATAPTLSAATLSGTTDLSGGQLKFPASQSASADANTLDDYEEGTFTPALTGTVSSAGITYTNQNGSYVKVGKAVHFRINLLVSSMGTASGFISITGLPFTAESITRGYCAVAVRVSGMTVTGTVMAFIPQTTTQINLEQCNNGAASSIAVSAFAASSELTVSGTYFV